MKPGIFFAAGSPQSLHKVISVNFVIANITYYIIYWANLL